MKKSKILLCGSALLLLASCGGGSSTPASSSASASSSAPASSASSAPASSASSAPSTPSSEPASSSGTEVDPEDKGLPVDFDFSLIDNDDMELLVWCAQEIQPTIENTIEDFKLALEEAGYEGTVEFTINAVSEGDAATKMVTDVESGADVYFFAQDQLSRLNTAGALAEVPELLLDWVKGQNTTGSVGAGTLANKLIAYPATDDNGYYLYYDKSVLSGDEIKNWETIIAKAESGEFEVDFNHGSAWYNFGFFYGAGADSVWSTDADGNFVEYTDTYDSAEGMIAARAMANIVSSARMVDNSGVSGAGDKCIALVDGTWDYNAAVSKWGENLGCAELPSFTVGGKAYHTGSFSGNKLVGVKPQTDEARTVITHFLGAYLNTYAAQEARYDAKGWGPSNKALLASEKVKEAPHLVALTAQNAYAKPQGQFPGKWWDVAGAIGPAIAKLGKEATDAQLKEVLETYSASLDSMLDA